MLFLSLKHWTEVNGRCPGRQSICNSTTHPYRSVIPHVLRSTAPFPLSSLSATWNSLRFFGMCKLWSSCCSIYLIWTLYFKLKKKKKKEKEWKSQFIATVLTLRNTGISYHIFFRDRNVFLYGSWSTLVCTFHFSNEFPKDPTHNNVLCMSKVIYILSILSVANWQFPSDPSLTGKLLPPEMTPNTCGFSTSELANIQTFSKSQDAL